MEREVRITKPILRAIDEGHRDLDWRGGFWEYVLFAYTGHHETGAWITRKLWETLDEQQAVKMADLLLAEFGIDTRDDLRLVQLRAAAAYGSERRS